uniref:Uncharacterized protein n=1 Tax=Anguilla anguilla TaxID=7936 RepID=A0A0E9PJA2_ANGAN
MAEFILPLRNSMWVIGSSFE